MSEPHPAPLRASSPLLYLPVTVLVIFVVMAVYKLLPLEVDMVGACLGGFVFSIALCWVGYMRWRHSYPIWAELLALSAVVVWSQSLQAVAKIYSLDLFQVGVGQSVVLLSALVLVYGSCQRFVVGFVVIYSFEVVRVFANLPDFEALTRAGVISHEAAEACGYYITPVLYLSLALFWWLKAECWRMSKSWRQCYAWVGMPIFFFFAVCEIGSPHGGCPLEESRGLVLFPLLVCVLMWRRMKGEVLRPIILLSCAYVLCASLVPADNMIRYGIALLYAAAMIWLGLRQQLRRYVGCGVVLAAVALYHLLESFVLKAVGFEIAVGPEELLHALLVYKLPCILVSMVPGVILWRQIVPPKEAAALLPSPPKMRCRWLALACGWMLACMGACAAQGIYECAQAPHVRLWALWNDAPEKPQTIELYAGEGFWLEAEGESILGKSLYWNELWRRDVGNMAEQSGIPCLDGEGLIRSAEALQPLMLRPENPQVKGSYELAPFDKELRVTAFLKQEDEEWCISRVEASGSSEDALREGELSMPAVMQVECFVESEEEMPKLQTAIRIFLLWPEESPGSSGDVIRHQLEKTPEFERWQEEHDAYFTMEVALRKGKRPYILRAYLNDVLLERCSMWSPAFFEALSEK